MINHKILYLRPILILGMLALIFSSCEKKNRLTDIRIDASNGLRAGFTIKTSDTCNLWIEYGTENDSNRSNSHVSEQTDLHDITIFNLSPHTRYEYSVVSDSVIIHNNSFITDSLPSSLLTTTLEVDNGNVFDGGILIRKVQDPGQQILLNNKGKIIWYEQFDTTLYRPFSLTSSHTILALKSDKYVHEFDFSGNVIFDLEYGENDFLYSLHHEIIKDENGNIISLTRNNQVFDLTSRGGYRSDTVKGDGIVVMDTAGNKVWEWDIFQHADPVADKNIMETRDDWSHGNSLSIDSDGHYLVSFRHFNQVWKINSGTGEVMWRLGENGDFPLDEDQIFYLQHAPHINPLGELMLFDNGGPERPTSRALSFKIQDDGSLSRGRVNVFLPPRLFSFKQGSSYLIGEDKILFCSSIKNAILITDLQGNILWHLKLDHSVYRAVYVKPSDLPF